MVSARFSQWQPNPFCILTKFKFKREFVKQTDDTAYNILEHPNLLAYIGGCIKLCLLMVATEPPVVIECPAWKRSGLLQTDQNINEKSPVKSSQNVSLDLQRRQLQYQSATSEDSRERANFNKDLFKEYTTRGKYLDFCVWPAMLLHKDGPILGKGVAQGSNEKYRF